MVAQGWSSGSSGFVPLTIARNRWVGYAESTPNNGTPYEQSADEQSKNGVNSFGLCGFFGGDASGQ
ncbi:MAG: hypothetical protein AAFV90_29385 [Cyanobacteria bacterium J06634_5]